MAANTWAAILCAAGVTLALIGCDRTSPNRPQTAGAMVRSPATPSDVIREILRVRHASQYSALSDLVLADRADDVTRTLVAVDDFLAANQALCELIRGQVGPGVSARVDQSHLADHLDVFSRYVELIGEEITGDRAVVRFTIDGKLPAKSAELWRIEARWRYDPGAGYSTELVAAFEKMTEGLRGLASEFRAGTADVAAFRDNPDKLVDEVRLRLAPGVRLFPAKP
ncbi:MAG: hypothetical protein JNG88_00050 [Phycisphaerales bacterium]|nr:hypothetical protein [Phycisphaerales bacterium]